MAGYWLNPNTGQCVRVDTTHDAWVRDRTNIANIGLPQAAYDAVMEFPETAIDEIRLVALDYGLVRVREHPRYTSVQFSAQPFQITPILQAVVTTLTELKLHSDTTLVIDNLLLHESARTRLGELQNKLAKGLPVFREIDEQRSIHKKD